MRFGPIADGPAPAAGAERHDLVEGVEQPGPLRRTLMSHSICGRYAAKSGWVSQDVRLASALLLEGGVGVDAGEAGSRLCDQVHLRPRVAVRGGRRKLYRPPDAKATALPITATW